MKNFVHSANNLIPRPVRSNFDNDSILGVSKDMDEHKECSNIST